jgi:hypothetical protein
MKRTIPFDLFGEKQELCFTIAGIAVLERALGKSIQQIVASQAAGFDFCLNALPICLKNIQPQLYVKKIEEYLDVEGHSIDDIALPIIHAICASGALGKAASNAALKIYYPEFFKDEDEPEKNG